MGVSQVSGGWVSDEKPDVVLTANQVAHSWAADGFAEDVEAADQVRLASGCWTSSTNAGPRTRSGSRTTARRSGGVHRAHSSPAAGPSGARQGSVGRRGTAVSGNGGGGYSTARVAGMHRRAAPGASAAPETSPSSRQTGTFSGSSRVRTGRRPLASSPRASARSAVDGPVVRAETSPARPASHRRIPAVVESDQHAGDLTATDHPARHPTNLQVARPQQPAATPQRRPSPHTTPRRGRAYRFGQVGQVRCTRWSTEKRRWSSP